ncbi:FkbM family methyltransferase [Roseibium sp. M-1]
MKKKRRLLNYIFSQKDEKLFSTLFNLYASASRILNGKNPWKVTTEIRDGKIVVTDEAKIQISILHQRRVGFYRSGIERRTTDLIADYLIDPEDIAEGDVFIDCGANIGEIGLGFRLLGKKVKYIAFEPGRDEISCCRLNNPEGTCAPLALWHEKTILSFYEKSDTADSSLIEFSGYEAVRRVETTTLDDYCSENNISDIKFLKIEGEGAEPEILKGAVNTLKRVKYVCVDCGPERGLAKESTLPAVCQFLMSRGFKFDRVTANRLTARFVADH